MQAFYFYSLLTVQFHNELIQDPYKTPTRPLQDPYKTPTRPLQDPYWALHYIQAILYILSKSVYVIRLTYRSQFSQYAFLESEIILIK